MGMEWKVDRSPELKGLPPVLDVGGVEVAGLTVPQMELLVDAHRRTVDDLAAEIGTLEQDLREEQEYTQAAKGLEEERDRAERRADKLEEELKAARRQLSKALEKAVAGQ